MKKFLSMVLAVSIVFGTAVPYAAADSSVASEKTDYQTGDTFIEGDLQYTVLEDGTLEVGAVYENKKVLKEVNIPAEVNGMAVTSIGNYTFYGCTNLTSVMIPDSVTSIGGMAFSLCTSLTTVTIPDSVTNIEANAFDSCTSLTTVTIPDSVTSIGRSAFEGCTSLTMVTIPDSVTSIGDLAFNYCTSLRSINVYSPNEYYCSVDGVLFNKDKTVLIQYPAGKTLKSYTIPNGVTSIRVMAFDGCTSLTTVAFSDGITSIEPYAFSGCTSLTTVTIPNSVTSIGGMAFSLCTSLTSVTISDSVTNIEANAFDSCTSLTSVTIMNSDINIGWEIFVGCTNLKDVYYSGTKEQWEDIYWNELPEDTTIHYNSIGPDSVQIEISKPASGNAPDTSGMKVKVAGDGEKPQTITIDEDGKLDLSGIADGKYSFTFSANNCAPRTYSVTVYNGTASGIDSNVELRFYGDLNGDGKINGTDVLKAKLHAKGSQKLSGYDLSVADVTNDGKINGTDVLKLKLHAKGSTKLW